MAHQTDLLVIGAGPTGLFATYYAGFRGLRVAVVDSLPGFGGQITAMYPEKQILDGAGFPSIKGRDLVDGLVAQASTAHPEYFLDRTAVGLEQDDDGVTVRLDDDTEIRAGAVLVTAGIGKFSPRPLPAGEGWLGRGLEFFVPSFQPYAAKDVVIVGGGDSAFDWALHLEPVARSVTLVHRREAFRPRSHRRSGARDAGADHHQRRGDRAARTGVVEEVELLAAGNRSPFLRRRWSPRSGSSPTSVAAAVGDQVSKRTSASTPRCRPASAGLRRGRRHRVRRQGAADRRRLRRSRDRGQQRGRGDRPARPRLPRPLQRGRLSQREAARGPTGASDGCATGPRWRSLPAGHRQVRCRRAPLVPGR